MCSLGCFCGQESDFSVHGVFFPTSTPGFSRKYLVNICWTPACPAAVKNVVIVVVLFNAGGGEKQVLFRFNSDETQSNDGMSEKGNEQRSLRK